MRPRRIRVFIFAFLMILICIGEYRFAMTGKFAFVRRRSLILAPLYAPGFTRDQIGVFRRTLEKNLAARKAHRLYPKSLIENFYLERDNQTNVFDGSYRGRYEALELGRVLEVDRVAIASVLKYSGKQDLSITIFDVKSNAMVVRYVESAARFQDLEMNFKRDMNIAVPGLTVAAWLYLVWLFLLVVWAVVLAFRLYQWHWWTEFILGSGVLLGLFSWIYALNGDMDYVQRFVATSGVLDIGDTGTERLSSIIRYIPPIFMLILYRILHFIGGRKKNRINQSHRELVVNELAPLWSGVSALLFSFSLPNVLMLEGWPLMAWAATFPLYIVIRNTHFFRAVSQVVFFVALQALVVNWWQGTFSYVSLPFSVVLTLFINLPFALILVFTVNRFRRFGLYAAPFFWVFWDWVRSLGFLGYPWGILGVSQYRQTGLIQMAALGGVWLVSFMPHFVSAMLAVGIESRGLVSRPWYPKWRLSGGGFALKGWWPLMLSFVAVLVFSLAGIGVIKYRDAASDALGADEFRELKILITQPNTDSRKHDYNRTYERLVYLTELAESLHGSFDLVAWPESAFVPDIRYWQGARRRKNRRGILVSNLLEWQSQNSFALLTGTQDHFYERLPERAEPVKRILNSAMYFPAYSSERDYYYKIRLVPFTENFPYGKQFPWIQKLLHNFSSTQWTPGNEYKVFNGPGFRFSAPICFEDVFPEHIRKFVDAGAEVLVNISNDYWANMPLEGYQHGAHAIFRAVENRRPLVRATTSGWTISVDQEGRIDQGWPKFYSEGWHKSDIKIRNDNKKTLYTRFGDWFPIACGIFWLAILVSVMGRKSYQRNSKRAKVLHGSNG